MFNLFFRDNLISSNPSVQKTAVVDEFDGLATNISAWAEVEHNPDGTHNLLPSGYNVVPVGSMVRWAVSTPPTNWLNCDGSRVSRIAYPILFRTIGISAGAGDGTTTFTLPTVSNFIILAA